MNHKTLKQKKCRVCKDSFNPWNSTQVVCSPKCAKDLAIKKDQDKKRKQYIKDKELLKTKSDYTKEAQAAFNSYIRIRDKGKKCISSGRQLISSGIGGGYDCGHYRSVGSAPHLRFNVFNAHGQSKHDNRYLSGNAVDYRKGLIKRLGIDIVERLESDNEIRKYSIEDLKRVKKIFNKRARLYQRRFRN